MTLAIPGFPDSRPKHVFTTCLLKIWKISDNLIENKLIVTTISRMLMMHLVHKEGFTQLFSSEAGLLSFQFHREEH